MIRTRLPLDASFRQAVNAAKIASVCDRDTQVINGTSEAVGEGHLAASDWREQPNDIAIVEFRIGLLNDVVDENDVRLLRWNFQQIN